jgi:hypothetical protein
MDSCCFDEDVACVAIPSLSGSALTWLTPAQCVWDDTEFSQNEIELKSKTALRTIMEQHMSTARTFFTQILELPNAGIHELLGDLALMQAENSYNSKRIHRIYERIESCRRPHSKTIAYASYPRDRHRLTILIDLHSKLAHSSFFGAYIAKKINGSRIRIASGPDQSCDLSMP